MDAPEEPVAADPAKPQLRRRLRLAVLLLATLLVGVTLGGITAAVAGWRINLHGATADPKAGAIQVCREGVKTQLTSPGSAQFSAEKTDDFGVGKVVVTGTVDSQNGFGALLRSTYWCVARSTGGGGWELDGALEVKPVS